MEWIALSKSARIVEVNQHYTMDTASILIILVHALCIIISLAHPPRHVHLSHRPVEASISELEDEESEKRFWAEVSEHSPEARIQAHRHAQALRDKQVRNGRILSLPSQLL